MSNGTPATALRSRLAGALLVCMGGVLLDYFVEHPTGELPGFSHAWRGGPLLLGASFFTINGFFLIFQKRFSLGALLVAGLLSAGLTSATHAYVRSIREVTTYDHIFDLPADKLTEFIARSRQALPPERLRQFVEDAEAGGWLPAGVDFDDAFITFGTVPNDKNKVVVTLNIESCPFVHPLPGDARQDLVAYSNCVHSFILEKLNPTRIPPPVMLTAGASLDPEDTLTPECNNLFDALVNSSRVMAFARFSSSGQQLAFYRKQSVKLVRWLCNQERDADVKQRFGEALKKFEAVSETANGN